MHTYLTVPQLRDSHWVHLDQVVLMDLVHPVVGTLDTHSPPLSHPQVPLVLAFPFLRSPLLQVQILSFFACAFKGITLPFHSIPLTPNPSLLPSLYPSHPQSFTLTLTSYPSNPQSFTHTLTLSL